MRLGHVIGTVTLALSDPALRGARFLLVQPFGPAQFGGAPAVPLAPGATVVVYDSLGAGTGPGDRFHRGRGSVRAFRRADAGRCLQRGLDRSRLLYTARFLIHPP